MPLTNAERVARFRAKKKANEAEYAEYKQKNAQEQRKSRCKKMMLEQKQPKRTQKQNLEKRRAETRKRVAKSRALKKEQQKDAEAQQQPFRSASAFGKALHRAKRAMKSALPGTPRRRKAVCRNLLRAEHGGAPDELDNAVKTRKTIVNNAASFVGASNSPGSSVEVFEMSTEDIMKENQALNLEQVFNDAPAINGISMAHLLVNNRGATVFHVLSTDVQTPSTADELTVARTDPPESDTLEEDSDDTAEVAFDIQVKDWCAVWYDGELFPGEVKSKVGDNYEVSTMARAGGYWKFPQQEDKIFYSKDKVEKKLECPMLVNARGMYKFTNFP